MKNSSKRGKAEEEGERRRNKDTYYISRDNREGVIGGWLNPFGYGGGDLILIFVIGASTYHATNGIRLIFTEGGKRLGRPGRPDYPYDALSLNHRQRSGIWVALVLAAVAMLYGANVLLGGG